MKTKDELGILWLWPDGHTEENGIDFYAYFDCPPRPELSSLQVLWQKKGGETKSNVIEFELGVVVVTTVRLVKWPSESVWLNRVERTLSESCKLGAIVSWCGGFGLGWKPDQLNPATGGSVYAGYSVDSGFLCNAGLCDEIIFLRDDQMALLYDRVVRGGGVKI